MGRQQLVWLDRRGEKTGEIGQAQEAIGSPALSPDGRLVAVAATEGSNQDVWVYDIARGVKTRVSSAPERDGRPVWSPAGDEVAFSSNRAGNPDIFLRQADGSGEEKVLASTPRRDYVSDWSRDGKYLLYVTMDPDTGPDLWYLERNEGGRKVTVSSNGGKQVRWSRDGEELFYVEGQTLVAVSVSSGSSFSVGSATRLFEHPGLGLGAGIDSAPYDISADGQRFILAEPVGGQAREPSIRVVLNWFAEFRDREQD